MKKEDIYKSLSVRVLNRRQKKDIEGIAPYVSVVGIPTACFYRTGIGHMHPVTFDDLECLGITERELFRTAYCRTQEDHPALFTRICDLAGLDVPEDMERDIFVLTNWEVRYGACVLFYPGAASSIANILGGSYYILPSSVHDLVIVPDKGIMSVGEMYEMVCDINKDVPEEDQLADAVFFYSAGGRELMCVAGGC